MQQQQRYANPTQQQPAAAPVAALSIVSTDIALEDRGAFVLYLRQLHVTGIVQEKQPGGTTVRIEYTHPHQGSKKWQRRYEHGRVY